MKAAVEILSGIVGALAAKLREDMNPVYKTLLLNCLTLKSTSSLFKRYGDVFNDENPDAFTAAILGNVKEVFDLVPGDRAHDETLEIYLMLLDILRILEQRSCNFSPAILQIKESMEAKIEGRCDASSCKKIESIFDALSLELGVPTIELLVAHEDSILSGLAALLSRREISVFELRYYWLQKKLPISYLFQVLNENQSIDIIAQNVFFSDKEFYDDYFRKLDIIEWVAEEAILSENTLLLMKGLTFNIPVFLLGRINSLPIEEATYLAESWHKFVTILHEKNTNLSQLIFISYQEVIGLLIDVMGVDTFIFLEKYSVENVVTLKEMLQRIPRASEGAVRIIKMYFSQYREKILGDEGFYKVFETVLIFCSELNISITRAINPLSPEDKLVFLNQLTRFIELIQKINDNTIASLSKYYTGDTHQFFIGQAIEVMGVYAFLFLEKSIKKDSDVLERIFEVVPSASENVVRMMQKYFNHNKDKILDNVGFYQSWKNILIISSQLGVSLTNVVEALDEEKTIIFFDGYTNFIEFLMRIDGGKAINCAGNVRFCLDESHKNFMAIAIEIMGVDAFLFLEKFIAESDSSLEKIFKIISASETFIHALKKCFNQYKKQILDKASFLKFFEETLVGFGGINFHDFDVVRSFSPEERDIFFESQDKFIMKFFKAYNAEYADDRSYFTLPNYFFRNPNVMAGIKHCLEIMGADGFLFFGKYLDERGLLALSQFFNDLPTWQAEDICNIMKMWFLRYKKQVLEEKRFFESFSEMLVKTRSVQCSFVGSLGSLRLEEGAVFLVNQEKFFQCLMEVYQDNSKAFIDFFEKNSKALNNLAKMMGADSFLFMEKYLLIKDVIALENMLNSVSFSVSEILAHTVRVWLSQFKGQALDNVNFFEAWEKALTNLGERKDVYIASKELMLLKGKKKFFEKHDKFMQLFLKVNRLNFGHETQYRNPEEFFMKHGPIIRKLIKIMGEDAFIFFEKYIAKTVLSLERMLESLSAISNEQLHDMQILFNHHRKIIFNGNTYKDWENALMIIMLVFEVSSNKTLIEMSNLIKPGESLAQLNTRLVNDLIKATFFSLQFSEKELDAINFDELSSLIPTQDFPKLVLGQQKMDKDQYYQIFIEILKSYVLKKSIEDVIHRSPGKVESEENPNIEKLKQHNERIMKALAESGVSIDSAAKNKRFHFVYKKKNDTSNKVVSVLRALCSYLAPLKEQLLNFKNNVNGLGLVELILRIDKMLLDITALESFFSENEHLSEKERYLLLSSEANKKSLNNLVECIDFLIENKAASLSAGVLEYAGHIKDAYKDLSSLKTTGFVNSSKEVAPIKFVVGHWDKNKITSLFLGAPVRCCLAPDGAQFPALIQRLMDDAMFFHVVTEEGSDVPVALSWLYFCVDSAKPDEVHIMANFLEISPKYGSDEDAKKVIINALLYYTQQFAKDIGAGGFLINHLTYGWISDFQCFEQRAMTPEKVGGCLNLDGSSHDSSSRYYLRSLHATDFHIYDLTKISSEDQARFLSSSIQKNDSLVTDKVFGSAPSFFPNAALGSQCDSLQNFDKKRFAC